MMGCISNDRKSFLRFLKKKLTVDWSDSLKNYKERYVAFKETIVGLHCNMKLVGKNQKRERG